MSVDGQPTDTFHRSTNGHLKHYSLFPFAVPSMMPIYVFWGVLLFWSLCTLPPRQRRFSHTLFGTVVLK
jgi:hypothetical protein